MISRWLPAASTYAADIDWLFDLIFALVGFWLVASLAVFFWLLFKFRKKSEGQKAEYITGEVKSQKRFITIPHLLVLICDVFIIYGAVTVWYDVKQNLPEEPGREVVRVIGQQWAWTFVHPGPDKILDTADDITKINELHIQSDTLYHYKLESKDVLHNFSVPVFRLKQDAIPGRVITGWFRPILEGEYDIQCAEICGIGHALMPARLFVESPAAHAAWKARNSNLSLAALPAPQTVQE